MKVFLVNALLTCSLFSYSQNVFKAGVLGGFTTAQIHGDAYLGFDKIGFNGGGFVTTELSDKFSFGFEIYYINKGSRKNPTKFNPSHSSIRLNYIEIPVLIKYHYKKITGEIGLSYGKLLNQKFLANGLEYTPDSERYFNKNEYGYVLGLNYKLKNNFPVNVRYGHSIWKVRTFTYILPLFYKFAWQRGAVNLALSLSLKYQFGAKKT